VISQIGRSIGLSCKEGTQNSIAAVEQCRNADGAVDADKIFNTCE
jgi:hypothetical protein